MNSLHTPHVSPIFAARPQSPAGALQQVMARDQLVAHFQPIVQLGSGAVHDMGLERKLMQFSSCGVLPENVLIELTEHERVPDLDALKRAIAVRRKHRVGIALDDFGDGRSSLRLWSEIQPDLVKIDKYFTRNVHAQPEMLQTFRTLLQLAETLGSRLVAEGNMRFHPCTTLCIGAVRIRAGTLSRSEDVASAAASAKREAKHGAWPAHAAGPQSAPCPPPC